MSLGNDPDRIERHRPDYCEWCDNCGTPCGCPSCGRIDPDDGDGDGDTDTGGASK